jgi:hypothetical protein
MSLINDALKRAHQAQQNQSPPPPESPLQPARDMRRSRLSWVGVLFVFGGLGLAAWLYFNQPGHGPASVASMNLVEPAGSWNADTAELILSALSEASAMSLEEHSPEQPPQSLEWPSSAGTQARTPPAKQAVRVRTPSGAQATPADPNPEPPAPFPDLRLQGIFFRANNPSALVNSRTVTNGSVIEGVTILKIERYSVLVEWLGHTRVLRMESF